MNDQFYYWLLIAPGILLLLGFGQLWFALKAKGNSPEVEKTVPPTQGEDTNQPHATSDPNN